MINVADTVYFYDDRSKYNWMYKLKTVLYVDDDSCLCVAECTQSEITDEKFFFNLKKGEVINSEFYSWLATNDTVWAEEELQCYKEE